MKISVIIHTYNAERFLERVLNALQGFDEIIICDMYSNDRTIEIAELYNCRIIYHENVGFADPARSFSISQATYEWVLMVDADEIITPALRDYLYSFIKDKPDIGGLRIPCKNYQLGRFMHSYYPNYILRFFRRGGTTWPPTVHSQPKVKGTILEIPKKRKDLAFIHLSNESISTTLKKTDIYTDFEIQRERRLSKNYGYLNLVFEPLFRFLKLYIIKGGFRDGKPGFIWACEYAHYKFITIAKIIESRVKPEDMDKELRGE